MLTFCTAFSLQIFYDLYYIMKRFNKQNQSQILGEKNNSPGVLDIFLEFTLKIKPLGNAT